jgi:hypothetical protein
VRQTGCGRKTDSNCRSLPLRPLRRGAFLNRLLPPLQLAKPVETEVFDPRGTGGSNPSSSSAESAKRLYPQSFSQPARWDYARGPSPADARGTVLSCVRSSIFPPFSFHLGAAGLVGECLYLSNGESGTSTFGKYYASATREWINACLRRGARSRRHCRSSAYGTKRLVQWPGWAGAAAIEPPRGMHWSGGNSAPCST